jgi:hypothetical protein
MQCILQASMGDSFDEELETGEVDDILAKLKSSVESDHRQAAVWNILGLVLLRGGQIQVWYAETVTFFSIVYAAVSAKNYLLIFCTLSRVLSQFYLLSRLLLQTTWTPLRILVSHTFKGSKYYFSCHCLCSDFNIYQLSVGI